MIGTQILHYRIEAKLGEGGMGEVFLATDTKLDRKVALKFLPPHFATDPESKARFVHEAKAAAALHHPNIITVFELAEHEGRLLIAMEYVEGPTLGEYCRKEDPTIDKILDLTIQIAQGLQKAQEAGIVHRDLKPANILVDSDGQARILDFGLAKLKGATKVTKTGSTMGTAAYMSPEQSQGQKVDHRTDIWSVGVILYEMLARRLPFDAEHEVAVAYAISNEEPEPLARYKKGVTDDLQRIVSKCLAKAPDERYQSAADLVADLKHARRTSESATHGTSTTAPSARRKDRRGLIVSASIVALVVVALVFKPWKITVEPTNEVAAVQNRLAIMYFDNLEDPDDEKRLGEIATNLLITDLSETPNLDVISNQRLYDLLKQLGHEGSKRIDRDVASQVAELAHARWMFLGSILQTTPHLIITAQLVDVSSGNTVASQRVEGQLDENIFAVVDRLTVEVKSDLALPESAQASFDPAMAEVTTSSPEAYRLYLEGVELKLQHRYEKARERFREAVAIDSTFAAVYFEWSKRAGEKESIRLSKLAMRYADHASPRQRDMIRANYVFVVEENPRKAIELFRSCLEKYPNEVTVLMGTFFAYRKLHHKDSALLALEELVELDPQHREAYNLMAYNYQAVGNFDRSIWAINKYIEIAPDEPNPYDTRGDLYSFEGMLDEARSSFAQALTIDPEFTMSRNKLGLMYMYLGQFDSARTTFQQLASESDPSIRSMARFELGAIAAYRGKFQSALQLFEQGIGADALDGSDWPGYKHYARTLIWIELGDLDAALIAATDGGSKMDPTDISGWRWWMEMMVRVHALRREFDKAQSTMQRLAAALDYEHETNDVWWFSAAHMTKARGLRDSTVVYLERAHDIDAWFWSRFELGRAYLLSGQLGRSVDMLEEAAKDFGHNREWAIIMSVTVYYYLGQAYEQSGWTDKAIAEYERFLNIWKDADPGLAKVADAKERLARLKGESSS